MVQFTVNTHRFDPYKGFKFRVKWDGKIVAGITKVSSLKKWTDPVIHREGNDPGKSRISPGIWKYEPITLERGLTHDKEFENWANLANNVTGDAAMSLKNFRKDIVIEILNEQGSVVLAYKVYRCWVSSYSAVQDLDANNAVVAIESIVLQNEGWERDLSVSEPAES